MASALLAVTGILSASPAISAAPAAIPLSVKLLDTSDDSVQLRLRIPADYQPTIELTGVPGKLESRLLISWPAAVALTSQPPDPGARAINPIRHLALHSRHDATELEITLARPMQALLHRVADSWVLRLDPAPPRAAPASAMPAPGTETAPGVTPRRDPGPPAAQASPAPEPLLIDMSVNGRPLPEVVRAELWPGDVLLLPADVWDAARLTVPDHAQALSDGTRAYRLDAIPGARFSLDRKALRLDITVPPTALGGVRIDRQAAYAAPPSRPRPGVVLNYDMSATVNAGDKPVSGNALLEAIAFGKSGSLVSSALVNGDGSTPRVQRLDTYVRHDMPDRMQTLVLGDTVGVAGGWSRPVRYAGLRWGRDFAMRPGFITMPSVALSADAALPSTVDVLVNNTRRMSEPVPPGPFELTNVPVVTGAGEINAVVRDLLGNETVIRQNYYASSRLLAPGLTDFSLEGGRMRFGYGSDSHYGPGFAAATVRTGLTRALTGELRVELEKNRRAAGLELSALLGHWAVGHLAVARSDGSDSNPDEHGQFVSMGLERSTVRGGMALSYERASAGFAPFGELADDPAAALLRPRERVVASAGGPVLRKLNAGVSYVRQTRWDGERIALAGLSLSAPLSRRATMNVSLSKELDTQRDWRASLLLSVPLGFADHLSARAERASSGEHFATVAASHPAPAGKGLGWNVEASSLAGQRFRAGVRYNADTVETSAEVASNPQGGTAARLSAHGSLGILAGLPFASRPIGESSFAVVDVGGLPGVPVLRSHQVITTTNARGLAFVPGLLPWQKNQIEIDPSALPLDAQVDEWVQEITPFAASGMVVDFAVKRSRQALLVLLQPDGKPVPVGTQVRVLPDGPRFLAGLRGEIWLSDLPVAGARVEANWAQGSCTIELPDADAGSAQQRIGPLTCGGKSR